MFICRCNIVCTMSKTKPIRIDDDVWELIGEAGTAKDTYNSALRRALELFIDAKKCMYGAEPETSELKKLKEMWTK